MSNAVCQFVIVGCGLGGLAAAIALRREGHNVTIFEQTKQLSQIGAGVQIPPNSTRILKAWGLLDSIKISSIEPQRLLLHSYHNGSLLSEIRLVPRMEEAYGAPWLLIHRADFQKVLADEAEQLGVNIVLGNSVTDIAISGSRILVVTSTLIEIKADVLLGADGLHSMCREMIQESPDAQFVTKDFVHRIVIKAEDIRPHKELVELLDNPTTNTWMGPGAHVASYELKSSDEYNFVFICSVPLGSLAVMRTFFKDWDSRLRTVLQIAREVKQWPLYAGLGKGRWINGELNFALLGDACHAMFPYLAQGAAQAVEDGATLGALFGRLQNKSEIRDILRMYEQLRKARTTKVMEMSTNNGQIFHMLDDETKRERDEQVPAYETPERSTTPWADGGFVDWLFGYDIAVEVKGIRESYEVRRQTR